ncbi:MAG: hypothetical protein GX129_08465 [Clostridiales bacterium]|jgi:hypothetical protein|nr:hypothetical protein [Clostridiales bacterium]
MNNITKKSLELVNKLFSNEDKEQAIILLTNECGNNLPYCEEYIPEELDRIRFAAIKISQGNIGQLESAIIMAKSDWRDLLMSADFAKDVNLHNIWADETVSL